MLSGPVLAQLFTAIVHVVVVLYIDRTTITTGHLKQSRTFNNSPIHFTCINMYMQTYTIPLGI